MNIYKNPLRIERKKMDAIREAKLRDTDFRISKVLLGKEEHLFTEDSPLRKQLVTDIGVSPYKRLSSKELLRLVNAAPYSVVGEVENLAEGGLVLSELMKREVTDEFLIARNSVDDKIYVIKGERTNNGDHQTPIPFVPSGPVMHIHPLEVDPRPSYSDFLSMMRDKADFGLVIGYKNGVNPDEIKLSKFYTLGPFRTIDFGFKLTKDTLDSVVHSLTKDSGHLRITYYTLRNGGMRSCYEQDIPSMLRQYREDMGNLGERISALETELYPDPTINFKKARELAKMYIETQHGLNATLLLQRLDQTRKTKEQEKLMRMAADSMVDITLRFK